MTKVAERDVKCLAELLQPDTKGGKGKETESKAKKEVINRLRGKEK